MTTLQEKIEVMQASANGAKIEVRNMHKEEWYESPDPIWAWGYYEYRVAETKPEPKVGIPVGMLDSDGEIRYVLKDSPAHKNLIIDGWKHILELDSEITLP